MQGMPIGPFPSSGREPEIHGPEPGLRLRSRQLLLRIILTGAMGLPVVSFAPPPDPPKNPSNAEVRENWSKYEPLTRQAVKPDRPSVIHLNGLNHLDGGILRGDSRLCEGSVACIETNF